jgi:hypothetical protein
MCDVGIPANQKDMHGNDLYSGDIVQLWHGNYIGTDMEEWLPSSGLTVIVGNQYKSYTDGTIELITNNPTLFTMGIASCGVQNEEWAVTLIKSHKDIINGERFLSFGINYRV